MASQIWTQRREGLTLTFHHSLKGLQSITYEMPNALTLMNEFKPKACRFDGTYDFTMELMNGCSEASRIINEELDAFYEQASERLKLEQPNLSPTQAEVELKNAVTFRFGNPVAKSCTLFRKAPNRWNSFLSDNFHQKEEQVRSNRSDHKPME